MGLRVGCAILTWGILLGLSAVAAGPLPLPPGEVKLKELRELGEVGAVDRSYEYGKLALSLIHI